MEFKTITEEDIARAEHYVPLAQKIAFADSAAKRCFHKYNVNTEDRGTTTAVPPMYTENYALKSRFLMGAFLKLYLKKDFETTDKDEAYLITQDEYDTWAGGHVFNQLERMKRCGGDTANKIFDMVNDYRSLEKMLNVEIYGLLAVANDTATRILAATQQQVTPETAMEQLKELEELSKILEGIKTPKIAETAEESEGE